MKSEVLNNDSGKMIVNFQEQHGCREKEYISVSIIERCYLSYKDKQMFQLLKNALRAAEQSWSYDIIKRVSPKEAEILKDMSENAKIRFRFSGAEFPPKILFKIYLTNFGSKYYSGKKFIRPASKAALEACKQMGNRKFYDQLIIDACQYEKDRITDEDDVSSLRDYMQLQSNIDETPSYLGGRENYWRELTLKNLPRHSIVYDIVGYMQTKSVSKRLADNMTLMVSRPVTREIQDEQYRVVTQLQTELTCDSTKYLSARKSETPCNSRRRSVQSRRRISKMKKLYSAEKEEDASVNFNLNNVSSEEQMNSKLESHKNMKFCESLTKDPSDFEVNELYEWTKQLTLDNLS